MRKIFIILLFAVTYTTQAQTMKEIFTNLPDSILPTLSHNDRLDCIDFIENNLTTEVNNSLKGKSRLTVLNENLMKFQISQMAEMQICKLPVEDKYILCVLHSVKIDSIWDTTVRFYNSDWTLINGKQFYSMPTTKDFLTKSSDMDDTQYQNMLNKSDYPLIQADFKIDNSKQTINPITLTLKYTSSNYKDEDYRKEVLLHVHSSIEKVWNTSRHCFE